MQRRKVRLTRSIHWKIGLLLQKASLKTHTAINFATNDACIKVARSPQKEKLCRSKALLRFTKKYTNKFRTKSIKKKS